MQRHAWERIGLDRARCDIPGATSEPEAECRRYDAALAAAGGLELVYLGVGADGHVGYNLPGVPRGGTHVVELPESLADSLEVASTSRPLRAITMGLGMIRGADRIVLMATGARKARAVRALLDGPEDPFWPCSLLRGHADLHVLLDREAAGR
jgi:glucosamine-6-phosphate deaminase